MCLKETKAYPILSICIPTTNRKNELMELVKTCLSIRSSKLEIVITDQNSTDGTKEELSKISDVRLSLYNNDKTLVPHLLMIQSIYNAKGKYALYCNDRDLLWPDKVKSLIDLLEDEEFAFIANLAKGKKVDNTLKIYGDAYSSLLNHEWEHHPTGLVFNCELIREFIPFEKILSYEAKHVIYYWDYLMRELSIYGKTAIWNNGLWSQRDLRTLKKKSLASINSDEAYYLPKNYLYRAKKTMVHTFEECNFSFTDKEKFEVMKSLINWFYDCGGLYKRSIGNVNIAMHYGLKKRFVHMWERIKIDKTFAAAMLEFFKEKRYPKIWTKWLKSNLREKLMVILIEDIKLDGYMILNEISELLNKSRC